MPPEVLRLISVGFPLEDALTMFYSMKREGTLYGFLDEQEKKRREQNNLESEAKRDELP